LRDDFVTGNGNTAELQFAPTIKVWIAAIGHHEHADLRTTPRHLHEWVRAYISVALALARWPTAPIFLSDREETRLEAIYLFSYIARWRL